MIMSVACFAGYKKKITRFFFISGIICSLFFIAIACAKEPDNLGRNILPSSDSIRVKFDTLTQVTTSTIEGRKIRTSLNTYFALGSMKDSIFGLSTASIMAQYFPLWPSTDTIISIDSLVLILAPCDSLIDDGYLFGDTLSEMTLRIYELNDSITGDTSYYSDINTDEYYDLSKELGNATFTAKDTLIRVKIGDPDFINKFLTSPDTTFKDLDLFAERFYGLLMKVDPVTDKGGYTYLNLTNEATALKLYVKGIDTSYVYPMSFSNLYTPFYVAHVNALYHDYNGFRAGQYWDMQDKDSLIFIDGFAGTNGKIIFPSLEEWRVKGPIAINKAELILPVDNILYPSLAEGHYPPKLVLVSVGENGVFEAVYDDLVDNISTKPYFKGQYDKALNAYIFNVGLHLQSYVSGKIENTELVLISEFKNPIANHVILKGGTSDTSPVKLKVTYTELF